MGLKTNEPDYRIITIKLIYLHGKKYGTLNGIKIVKRKTKDSIEDQNII